MIMINNNEKFDFVVNNILETQMILNKTGQFKQNL